MLKDQSNLYNYQLVVKPDMRFIEADDVTA